ncbi:MAG: hypothetical protein E7359_03085 [Clostridiales bacterium]|nr:hypothetical protein [Clostridiales bacterium]
MKMFLHELEELKKEVWFLKNKTIKELLEEVALLTGGQLDSTVIGRIVTLEDKVTGLENGINSLEVEVKANDDSLGDFGQHLAEIGVLVQEVQNDIADINIEIDRLKRMDEIISSSIVGVIDQITLIQQELEDKITAVGERVDSLEANQTDISNLENRTTVLEGQIESLNQKVDGLEGGNTTEIQQQIDSLIASDEAQDVKIDQLTEENVTISGLISANHIAIESLNTNVSEIQEGMSELGDIDVKLGEEIENLTAEQTALKASVEVNSTSLATLQASFDGQTSKIEDVKTLAEGNSSKITALEESDAGQDEDIADAQADISLLNETTTSLSSSVATMEATLTTNSEILATLQAEIQSLKSQIGSSGGSSTVTDLIYDMRSEDAAINYGFTSGIFGGKFIKVDLTPYSKLRIFATANNGDVEVEMDLINRQNLRTGVVISNCSSPKMFYNFCVYVPTAKNRVQVLPYAEWYYNSTEQVITVENGTTHDHIYVYRVEGIRQA